MSHYLRLPVGILRSSDLWILGEGSYPQWAFALGWLSTIIAWCVSDKVAATDGQRMDITDRRQIEEESVIVVT